MANNGEKCNVSLILEDAGYKPHEEIEGFNVWKNKSLIVVWQSNKGIRLVYHESDYSTEKCKNDILKFG